MGESPYKLNLLIYETAWAGIKRTLAYKIRGLWPGLYGSRWIKDR